MKRAWQAMSLGFAALSAFVLANALRYPLFDPLGPGPGFFPAWLGAIAFFLALVLFAQVSFDRLALPSGEGLVPPADGARRVGAILVGLVGAFILFEPLGYRLTMLLFTFFLPLALGARNYLATAVLAAICSLGSFYVFYYVFRLPLPVGILGL